MTALLSLSGPVEESCYVTLKEERFQRKKAAGETGPDLQVQPLWEDGLLSAAAFELGTKTNGKKTGFIG